MQLLIKKLKYDINGNRIYNIKLIEKNYGVIENRTQDFLNVCNKNKLLKNGTLNIKGYKSNIIKMLKKRSAEIYNNNKFEIIEL